MSEHNLACLLIVSVAGLFKEMKVTQAAKKLLTSIKEKGPLGKKSPFTRKDVT